MAFGTAFKKGATTATELASNAKYLDSITGAARQTDDFLELTSEFADQTTLLKSTVSANPNVVAELAGKFDGDQLKSFKSAIGEDGWAKLVAVEPDLAKNIDTAGDAAATAARAPNLEELASGAKLTDADNIALNAKYAGMDDDALQIEAVKYMDDPDLKAFKKLPSEAQAKLTTADPKLRWKSGNQPAGFEWIKGACKNYPKMCVIGATGGLAGAGYASYKIVKAVETAFDDKSAEKRACIATCLPDDFYESKVSGYGTKDYKDLTFRTVEDVKEDSGDDNITKQNTPLCTASMDPPEKCQDMCVKRCDQIHKTFLQRLANTAGGLAKDVVKEASGVAGEGLGGFLDGFFGDGMGIPSAIGIFVFIMIVMVLVTMM